jgi:hypothetical protein
VALAQVLILAMGFHHAGLLVGGSAGSLEPLGTFPTPTSIPSIWSILAFARPTLFSVLGPWLSNVSNPGFFISCCTYRCAKLAGHGRMMTQIYDPIECCTCETTSSPFAIGTS